MQRASERTSAALADNAYSLFWITFVTQLLWIKLSECINISFLVLKGKCFALFACVCADLGWLHHYMLLGVALEFEATLLQ